MAVRTHTYLGNCYYVFTVFIGNSMKIDRNDANDDDRNQLNKRRERESASIYTCIHFLPSLLSFFRPGSPPIWLSPARTAWRDNNYTRTDVKKVEVKMPLTLCHSVGWAPFFWFVSNANRQPLRFLVLFLFFAVFPNNHFCSSLLQSKPPYFVLIFFFPVTHRHQFPLVLSRMWFSLPWFYFYSFSGISLFPFWTLAIAGERDGPKEK